MTHPGDDDLRERLSRALPAAMKARDRLAVSALRSALAAIDNAGAVDPTRIPSPTDHPAQAAPETDRPHLTAPGPDHPASSGSEPGQLAASGPGPGHPALTGSEPGHPEFAGTVAGVGATEVGRRSLTPAQVEAIVRGEVADRESAAAGYEHAGQLEHAARLRGEAEVLTVYLDTS